VKFYVKNIPYSCTVRAFDE